MKITTLEEFKDEILGKINTQERLNYELELLNDLFKDFHSKEFEYLKVKSNNLVYNVPINETCKNGIIRGYLVNNDSVEETLTDIKIENIVDIW